MLSNPPGLEHAGTLRVHLKPYVDCSSVLCGGCGGELVCGGVLLLYFIPSFLPSFLPSPHCIGLTCNCLVCSSQEAIMHLS